METLKFVVVVKALPMRGNKLLAQQYIREAVRGWKGQYMPDDSRNESYEWDTASVRPLRYTDDVL